MSSLSRRSTGLAERLSPSGRPGVSSDLLVVPSDHTSVSTSHRPRDYYLRRLLAVTDVVALALGAVLAGYLPGPNGFGDQFLWFLLTMPLWIALFGAFLAANEGEPVRMDHLLRASRREYAKLERPLTDTETRGWLNA